MEITTITELFEALKELGEPEHGHTRFFRGHSRISYELKPSIYRLKSGERDPFYLIKNEEKIIRDAITNCPDSFSPNDTLFEKLVRLQHYGYATRLLDLTANALVALYFAVEKADEDGELIVLDIPDTEIKYDDSDVVAVLSAISLRNSGFDIEGYLKSARDESKIAADIYSYEQEEKKKSMLEDPAREFMRGLDKNYFNSEIYKQSIDAGERQAFHKAYIETFNKQEEVRRLLHDIRHDKPSFAPIIDPNDLSRVVCVRAKLNNPRIIRQQGCFLLFGMNEEKQNCAEIEETWIRSCNDNKLIINKEFKNEILKELKSFGISRQNLFPELDAQAKDIMDKYR